MLAVFRTERSIARIRMAAIGPISAALKGPHGGKRLRFTASAAEVNSPMFV